MKTAFIDIETLGLDVDLHATWEVGLILRDEEHDDEEFHWFLPVETLAYADPYALKITGFHDRHPQGINFIDPKDGRMSRVGEELGTTHVEFFSRRFARLTRDALWIGDTPSFDEERLRRMLRANGLMPAWDYHLIDVSIAAAAVMQVKERCGLLPGREALMDYFGLNNHYDEHTALGDARWARDLFDVI